MMYWRRKAEAILKGELPPYYERVESPEEYPFGVKGEEENGEERPCNCGSGVPWPFCQANSPYCG